MPYGNSGSYLENLILGASGVGGDTKNYRQRLIASGLLNKGNRDNAVKQGSKLEGLMGNTRAANVNPTRTNKSASKAGNRKYNTSPQLANSSSLLTQAKDIAVFTKDYPEIMSTVGLASSIQSPVKTAGLIHEQFPGSDSSTQNKDSAAILNSIGPASSNSGRISSKGAGLPAARKAAETLTKEQNQTHDAAWYHNRTRQILEDQIAKGIVAPEFTSDAHWGDIVDTLSNFAGIGLEGAAVKGSIKAVRAANKTVKVISDVARMHPVAMKAAGVSAAAAILAHHGAGGAEFLPIIAGVVDWRGGSRSRMGVIASEIKTNLTSEETTKLAELRAQGVKPEGTTKKGANNKLYLDVHDSNSIELRRLLHKQSSHEVKIDNPQDFRAMVAGVDPITGQSSGLFGIHSFERTRKTGDVVFTGNPVENVIEHAADSSSIDAQLAHMDSEDAALKNEGFVDTKKRRLSGSKIGKHDIVSEEFRPGVYHVQQDPTVEDVLAQLRKTDAEAAQRAKNYGHKFKPTIYTEKDANNIIIKWRKANPDAPWQVMQEVTRTKPSGGSYKDYAWVQGATIEHINPVQSGKKVQVGHMDNVIVLPGILNSARGKKPLFSTGKTSGWLKSMRVWTAQDIKTHHAKAGIKVGDARFASEADNIAAHYGAVWDPIKNDYVIK